jgi:hypothetical protein
VTSYTVTISPDDSSGTTTTLRLDVSAGEVLVTDLHVHAGTGLSTGQLPAIDFGLLLQAVNPATATAIRPATDESATARAGTAAGRAGRRVAGRAGRRSAEGGRQAGARGRGRAKAAAARQDTGGRAYRRMPDDLLEVYQRIGSVTAVAEHYQVPRHTVHGWLRRLRGQGQLPAS